MTRRTLTAQFLESEHGRLFVLTRVPQVPAQAPCPAALLVPPFAEEMNKSRRCLTDLAEALAERGVATVLPDLFGTGDSEGDFADATWSRWRDDLQVVSTQATAWGLAVKYVVGVRLGCTLAASWARRSGRVLQRTVFWQPVVRGEVSLTQLLRMRMASKLIRDDGESVAGLRRRIASGEPVEAGGYVVSPALASELEELDLSKEVSSDLGEITWFDVGIGDSLLPHTKTAIHAITTKDVVISGMHVEGAPFWMSSEIVRNPDLIEATVSAITK